MKNLLKKISAVAMAFTLLGTGTAISKNSPKPTNTLTAHAEFAHNCSSYKYEDNTKTLINISLQPLAYEKIYYYYNHNVTKCAVCGKTLSDKCFFSVESKPLF